MKRGEKERRERTMMGERRCIWPVISMMMIALDSVCDMPAAKADAPVTHTDTTELKWRPHDTHDTRV